MPTQILRVPQSQFNAELQNITNQTNDLIALGIPQNLAQSYGDNATIAAMNPNSVYYTGGLSATEQANNSINKLNDMAQGGDGSGIPSPVGSFANRVDAANQGAISAIKPLTDLFGTVSDLKNWTIPRAAIVIIGAVMLVAGIVMLSNKETINIAPTIAKTVAENPEMVA